MEKNGEYTGTVSGLGTDGEGIIKCDGTTAFVPYCLEGEEVVFTALKVTDSVVYGKLSEVLTVSDSRTAPECPVFERCGGCQLQHMTYEAQLEFKQRTVRGTVKKIAGLDIVVQPCVESPKRYRYRNKLAMPVGRDAAGNSVMGFYAPRSHRIVSVSDCPIQEEWCRDVVTALRRFMSGSGVEAYDWETGEGCVRHIVVREIQGNFVITLVSARMINTEGFIRELDAFFPSYTLLLNVNTGRDNVILSDEWHICKGNGFFIAEENGIAYRAGANTFLQVNDGVRGKLYGEICDAAAEKNTVAIDLYSGGGMLTAMLAKKCGRAYGIEMVEEAHLCAEELRKLNSLGDRMVNICGKVEDRIGDVFAATEGMKRLVVCDPPRKGMDMSVTEALLKAAPERIALVSCSPATLARDLGLLMGSLTDSGNGLVKSPDYDVDRAPYRIDFVIPFDMFPQTRHVETLCLLSRK